MKAYVDNGNLPSGVRALLSKSHSSAMGIDINSLCRGKPGAGVQDCPYDERPVPGIKMTHEVVDGDSAYQCALAPDVELVGRFETGFIAVRYENGAVVFVLKRMVKRQAAMLPEPAEICTSTITDEQKNKA